MEITVCRDDGIWSGELLRRSERRETELKFGDLGRICSQHSSFTVEGRLVWSGCYWGD
jgi:hypothetical protein